ncbi:AzlD domain-containing protein [Bordetella hinzii]|jgi:branched-subunit amino acid transport protein|uniref:AzlD domain-containing protein n=2 Tax=Bordetella hinzii TaxID=103855 RepID=A0AAN1RST7_9BORD|nr:AzlD domain-containing protein [Bordetella hinzii]AKQ54836.1 Branched-chain amino acid transport protein (AzlD) [Bordetella hinzii]AKQ59349.1 Branched-chain amino acid transport protein (AzlD) [Bordetella hinzii]AZW15411.1 AzlD domain-containing protein [Bordetella hinzii]KCB24918.1 branched-chain amino acid transport protein AzlD [Bordetella hinzii OH87 BAL007II]KCB27121.1 branched-chain amino acid transport protein AzlD [Bordetella hinzii CA90 BAL1384]
MKGGLDFWAAVLAMAVITYLTRGLPFMLSSRNRLLRKLSEEGSALSALGPALLAAIAAAVIVPDLWGGQRVAALLPYLAGLAVTALAVRLSGNSGVAVIAGLIVYGAMLAGLG